MLKTINEVQSVDLVANKGLAIRFRADDGEECVLQVPHKEAQALSDMLAIALSR
jgi:hypothetical protein